MRCEFCNGIGYVEKPDPKEEWPWPDFVVCPECLGLRYISCCEGSYRHGQHKDAPWVDWPPEGTNGH